MVFALQTRVSVPLSHLFVVSHGGMVVQPKRPICSKKSHFTSGSGAVIQALNLLEKLSFHCCLMATEKLVHDENRPHDYEIQ